MRYTKNFVLLAVTVVSTTLFVVRLEQPVKPWNVRMSSSAFDSPAEGGDWVPQPAFLVDINLTYIGYHGTIHGSKFAAPKRASGPKPKHKALLAQNARLHQTRVQCDRVKILR